jgi:hypothetical protein
MAVGVAVGTAAGELVGVGVAVGFGAGIGFGFGVGAQVVYVRFALTLRLSLVFAVIANAIRPFGSLVSLTGRLSAARASVLKRLPLIVTVAPVQRTRATLRTWIVSSGFARQGLAAGRTNTTVLRSGGFGFGFATAASDAGAASAVRATATATAEPSQGVRTVQGVRIASSGFEVMQGV